MVASKESAPVSLACNALPLSVCQTRDGSFRKRVPSTYYTVLVVHGFFLILVSSSTEAHHVSAFALFEMPTSCAAEGCSGPASEEHRTQQPLASMLVNVFCSSFLAHFNILSASLSTLAGLSDSRSDAHWTGRGK